MKNLIFVLFFLCAVANAEIETDKIAHFGVSYAANSLLYNYFRSRGMSKKEALVTSTFAVLLVGFAKESIDATVKHPSQFDVGDMGANALGSGLFVFSASVFDF